MRCNKHAVLLAFVSLQLLGAAALVLSFFLEAWLLELLVSFTPQLIAVLVAALIVSTIVAIGTESFRRSMPLLIVMGVTWFAVLGTSLYVINVRQPVNLAQSSRETFTFATFNKLYSNHDTERLTDYFNKQTIDVLALQEVWPAEVPDIAEQLGFEYMHASRTFATSGGTSVALLSRYPFQSVETIELETEHPVARAVVETPSGENIAVYSVHIPVPSSPFLYNKRNTILDSLAKTVQQEELPVIIGGDFNTTVFSPTLRSFTSSTDEIIQPVLTSVLPQCSWYGFGPPACIRIDHVYVPDKAKVSHFIVAPDLGSDHRAVITAVSLRP